MSSLLNQTTGQKKSGHEIVTAEDVQAAIDAKIKHADDREKQRIHNAQYQPH